MPFGYAKDVAPIMWGILVASVIEVGVVHLLLANWPIVRLIAVVVSVVGLVYTIGLTANIYVYPHLADDGGLRIRYGASTVQVPWSAIGGAAPRRASRDGMRTFQVHEEDGQSVLSVVVGGQTTVDLAMTEPLPVTLRGRIHHIDRVRFHADDPGAVVRYVRGRVSAQ